MKHWLNIQEAAEYAGITRQTMTIWMDDGLKHSRIGRLVRIKPENIDAYIERFESKDPKFDIDNALKGII